MTKTTIGFTIFLPTHPATKNPHHRLLLIQSAPWAFAPKFQSLRDAWNLMISLIGSKPSNVYSISANRIQIAALISVSLSGLHSHRLTVSDPLIFGSAL
uniref:Uncharacterized protein n=1 Tax=Helianthus annuus TaxID=4232 RepID=A0A251UAJ6_HELAN